MKISVSLLILWLATLGVGRVCAEEKPSLSASDSPRVAPLLQIALHCEEFDGRILTVVGVGNLAFEKNQLCPSEGLSIDPLNCFWLDTEDLPDEAYRSISQQEPGVWIVEGTIDCSSKGHMSLSAGTISALVSIVDVKKSALLWQRSSP